MRFKKIERAEEVIKFSKYVEYLFSVNTDVGEITTTRDIQKSATLAEVIGFDNMIRLCIALGGERVTIPRLNTIARGVSIIRTCQLYREKVITRGQALRVMTEDTLKHVIRQMKAIDRFNNKASDLAFTLERHFAQDSQEGFEVPNHDDEGSDGDKDPYTYEGERQE